MAILVGCAEQRSMRALESQSAFSNAYQRDLPSERAAAIYKECNYVPGTRVSKQVAQCFAEHLTLCPNTEGWQIIYSLGVYEVRCCTTPISINDNTQWHFIIDASNGHIYDVLPCGTGYFD
jgi:hypothetical protein